MKISVKNFKAIKELDEFEIKPLTILCGTNSCGKSSLIQLFLVLKQTLENTESGLPLVLNKPYVSLGKYKNIVHNSIIREPIAIKIKIDPDEFNAPIKSMYRRIFRATAKVQKSVEVKVCFSMVSGKLCVCEFELNVEVGEDNYFIKFNKNRGNKYTIQCNTWLFSSEHYREMLKDKDLDPTEKAEIRLTGETYFNKFFPEFFEEELDDVDFFDLSPIISNVKKNLELLFKKISYIGPLRDEPHLYYYNENDSYLKVGNKGEFAAHVLANRSTHNIKYYKIKENASGISYIPAENTLESAVNYWLCDIFQLAKNVKVDQKADKTIYSIILTNNFGLKVPINHVGFGVSQILPIIVEGLLLGPRSVMILEQPEIHLHPRVQSLMYDFLYSLTLLKKNFVIETHSDHFITRMRRRVVEDITGQIYQTTNLTFIKADSDFNRYEKLEVDEFASLSFWPPGFLDVYDKDLRAIVKAQTKKKLTLGGK